MKNFQDKKKIFIGLTEISGYYKHLSSGLRDLGHDVTFVSLDNHIYNYGGESDNWVIRFFKTSKRKRISTPKQKVLSKVFWILINSLSYYILFLWALLKHDVFIFAFGVSFNKNSKDLIIFKLLNKTIISNIAHGAEARPTYIDGGYLDSNGDHLSPSETYELDSQKIIKLKNIEKYSTHVLCTPFACHFLQKNFIIANLIGLPIEFPSILKPHNIGQSQSNLIKIVHAPSHPHAKGTYEIRACIKQLTEEGYEIMFIELQGKPHAEVMQALSECDFVIDQLYSDTPMAGLGAEASVFGKPTVIGGYLWSQYKEIIPSELIPPSLLINPDNLYNEVKSFIENPKLQRSIGKSAKDFAEKFWTPKLVAEKYLTIIENRTPTNWYFNPSTTTNIYGAGMSKNKTREVLKNFVDCYSINGLRISDKRQLLDLFCNFIKS